LSRFEGKFTAAADVQLSMSELLGLVEEQSAEFRKRQEAIACCLSGGDGWREALQALGGSFAGGAAEAGRLRRSKAE
jgi:hypothetical protein